MTQYRSRFSCLLLAITLTAFVRGVIAAPPGYPPAQQEYWTHFDRHDWGAAIELAEKLVNAARATPGGDPQQLADALTLLGNAYLGSKNLPAAETAYAEALKIVESRVGATSEKLLDPMRGLGYTLASAGRHEQAVPLLEKALVVARRSYGLFDVNQLGLLRQLANSLTAVDQVAEAERHILYTLRIGERAYGNRDARLVPLLCGVGDWYAQIGSMAPARESYRTALSLAAQQGGKASLAMVEPLRGLAASYRRELFLSNAGLLRQPEQEASMTDPGAREVRPITAQFLNVDGERALLRAVKILESDPAHPPELMIDTLVDTGDWYQTRNQASKALPFYRRAAGLVPASMSDGTGSASSPFAFPVQVYLPMPLLATRNRSRPDAEVDERSVQVEFTVTNDGAVKDERIVSQDATARQAAETLDAIRAARYRPRFVNGEPMETAAVGYRQIFRQRKEKEAEKNKES